MITIVEYLKLKQGAKKTGRTYVFFNAVFSAVFTLGVTGMSEDNSERPVVFHYKGDEFRTTYDGFVHWVNNHIKKS